MRVVNAQFGLMVFSRIQIPTVLLVNRSKITQMSAVGKTSAIHFVSVSVYFGYDDSGKKNRHGHSYQRPVVYAV